MDPVHPWLDPIEVRRLAERLLMPVQQPAMQVVDAGFGEQFVGFAPSTPFTIHQEDLEPRPSLPIPPSKESVATPPEKAEVPQAPPPGPGQILSPSTVPAPQPSPTPEPAVPVGVIVRETPVPKPHTPTQQTEARGPFLDRVGRFRDWLRHHFEATGIFLLDREGAVIFDESGHGKLHFLARSLAAASRRPGAATANNVHVKVGAAATLEVIPVDTPYGCIVLGAVVPAPLEPDAVSTVMDALKAVAAPTA